MANRIGPWSVATPSDAQGVAADGRTLFVGLRGGSVVAYPLDCANTCRPTWSAEVGGDDAWHLLLDDEGLYVTTSAGDFTPGLRLAAFLATR